MDAGRIAQQVAYEMRQPGRRWFGRQLVSERGIEIPVKGPDGSYRVVIRVNLGDRQNSEFIDRNIFGGRHFATRPMGTGSGHSRRYPERRSVGGGLRDDEQPRVERWGEHV